MLYEVLQVSEQLVCNSVVLPQSRHKALVRVIINLRRADSVCFYSMDFVSGTKIKINKKAAFAQKTSVFPEEKWAEKWIKKWTFEAQYMIMRRSSHFQH